MSPPNLAQFRLPSSRVLASRTLEIALDDGTHLSLDFDAEGHVAWTATTTPWADSGLDPCDVVEIEPGIFFIDIDFIGRPLEALTLLVSENSGRILTVYQRRIPGNNPAVEQTFLAGVLEGAQVTGDVPAATRDFAGRWHWMRYAPENLYEHIYLSTTKMCSHNLATANTPGRADGHDATYWRFSEGIYLMGWRERDSEAGMVMCEDLNTLRSTGKVLHPISAERSGNAPVGGEIMPVDVRFPDILTVERP